MEKDRRHYPDIAPTGAAHVRAVRLGDVLQFFSGTTALGTPAQGGSLVEQSRAVLTKIQRMVERDGLSMSDIVKLTMFVTKIEEYRENEPKIDAVFTEFFKGDYPANTLIGISKLAHEGLDIEIETIVGL